MTAPDLTPASPEPSAPSAPMLPWRRLDWRFLLPSLSLESVLCAGEHDARLRDALNRLGVAWADLDVDSRVVYPVAHLRCPSLEDLRQVSVRVEPGGWVVAEILGSRAGRLGLRATSGPQTLSGWASAFRAVGYTDVEVYWNAPGVDNCSRVVPLGVRPIVREALMRHEAVRFGLLKSLAGRAALRAGIFGRLAPEGTVVGRVPDGPGR